MSTITRDVVIRVAVQGVGGFTLPNVAPATAGMDGFTTATNTAQTAVNELSKATEGVTGATNQAAGGMDDLGESAKEVAVNTGQLAQGLLLMGRGLALATGASQESTAELVKMFAVVQAGRDALRGATMAMDALKASTNSNTAAMAGLVGPIGAVIGAVLTIVQALDAMTNAFEEASNAIKAFESELSASSVSAIESGNAMKLRSVAFLEGEEKSIELLKTRSELERTLAMAPKLGLDAAGTVDLELKTREQIITATQQYAAELERAASAQENEIKGKQEALRLATDLLDKEKERVSTIQASVGALTAAQKIELERLVTKLESGQDLSRREAENLSKYGQGDLAKKQFEKLGQGELADRLAGLRGGPSKVDELTSARDEARKALGVEDGETPEQAVARELKSLRDNTAAAKKEQIDIIRELLQQQRETQQELARLRQAEIIKKHAKGG